MTPIDHLIAGLEILKPYLDENPYARWFIEQDYVAFFGLDLSPDDCDKLSALSWSREFQKLSMFGQWADSKESLGWSRDFTVDEPTWLDRVRQFRDGRREKPGAAEKWVFRKE